MKRSLIFAFAILSSIMLAGCAQVPEIMVVEVTRLVPVIEEVEVTRLVEVEKEVTRVVEVLAEAPLAGSGEAADLDFLQIEFWPDYDKPSVLVLLTGSLADSTVLPVEIAVPVPESADINAVAQIDEGGMTSIDYQLAGDSVIFRSSTPQFRVEYYAPYAREGSTRSYQFAWAAPFSVAELAVQIQRPFNASDLFSEPAPSGIVTDQADGLDYFLFESIVAPRGETFELGFSYSMTSDRLTIDELSGAAPTLPESPLHDQQARAGRQT